jgi:hypothetical protein
VKKAYILPLLGLSVIIIAIVLLVPFIYLSSSRNFTRVEISADRYNIVGYLSEGTSPNGLWVIFGHGNRQEGQDHKLYQKFLHNLRPDVSILAVDFRGFGQSSAEGLEVADSIWDRSGDFNAAIAYLRTTYHTSNDQIILIGHSLGAAQALKAAQRVHYRLVIPIGLGDYDVVLASRESIREYSEKLSNNFGVNINPEVIIREGEEMRPLSLFSPCPITPVVLVFGAQDDKNSLLYSKYKVPDHCNPPILWRIIPFADHMYGTEKRGYPKLITEYYSTVTMSFLIRTINQLSTE